MKPGYRILRGRIERFVIHYHGPQFHAIVCDPPYELGFMGKDWDKSGIAFQPEIWAGLKELMLPGAFGMAFASARGWHRLAVAIEDAGFRIHPSIFGWTSSQGFPKATRIDTQIDKAAGAEAERKIIGFTKGRSAPIHNGGQSVGIDDPVTLPATPLAKTWAGHRYGLQALKPALEPIVVFQKPYEGKPVDSIIKTGAGAFNIDGARIRVDPSELIVPSGLLADITCHPGWGLKHRSMFHTDKPVERSGPANPEGRWPANFYLDEEAARRLGEQSGDRSSARAKGNPNEPKRGGHSVPLWGMSDGRTTHDFRDTGTAARFFLNVDWKLEHSDPVLYCPKASRKERDAGLEEVTRTIPHAAYGDFKGTPEHAPNTMGRQRNPHPTLKPIKLTQWLSTLLLPPEEYAPRRILVPFAGSGSEMIGAILAGWDVVIGIEMEKEYVEIAKARLKYWVQKNQPRLF